MAKFRRINKASDVVKHGRAEERFNSFEDEGAAVGTGDAQIAPKENKKLAQGANHEVGASCSGGRWLPVRRRKASSREVADARDFIAAGVSKAMRRPSRRTATRSASSSISESA